MLTQIAKLMVLVLLFAACEIQLPASEKIIPPTLIELDPATAAAGTTITVMGRGGYIELVGGGYNESARKFDLLFDDQVVGELACYANACFAELTLPSDASAGEHTISTEGGSSLTLAITN